MEGVCTAIILVRSKTRVKLHNVKHCGKAAATRRQCILLMKLKIR